MKKAAMKLKDEAMKLKEKSAMMMKKAAMKLKKEEDGGLHVPRFSKRANRRGEEGRREDGFL